MAGLGHPIFPGVLAVRVGRGAATPPTRGRAPRGLRIGPIYAPRLGPHPVVYL